MMIEGLRAEESEAGEAVERRLPRGGVAEHVLDPLEGAPVSPIEGLAEACEGDDAEEHHRWKEKTFRTPAARAQIDEAGRGEDREERQDQEEMLVRHPGVERERRQKGDRREGDERLHAHEPSRPERSRRQIDEPPDPQ